MKISYIPEIDRQHTVLLNTLTNLRERIGTKSEYSTIVNTVIRLVEYADYHFKCEEAVMHKYNYAGLPDQIIAHNSFRDYANSLNTDLFIDDIHISEIINYVEAWLVNHIDAEADEFKKMKDSV